MGKSLVLLKPDAVRDNRLGVLIHELTKRFEIKHMVFFHKMDDELCDQHYRDHVEKDFYPGLKKFMTSGPFVAMVLKGPIEEIREEALTLRKMFKPNYENPENLIHASDSEEAAEYEVNLWFGD
jgi:nucleoside-diphosphate kinase